jgi:predicted nucleic acid-binding protein
MKILIDSDIIIDYLKTGNDGFPRLLKGQQNHKWELYISSVTVFELFAGKSSKTISGKLHELVEGFDVVPVGIGLAQFAGELKRDYALTISFADLLIAATCLSIGAKLATRNKKHYHGIPKLQFAV